MNLSLFGAIAAFAIASVGCGQAAAKAAVVTNSIVGTQPGNVGQGTPLKPARGHELAAFSAGCFWGVEDVFRHTPGVIATAVGYTGGRTANPTYRQVCSHTTGHAETVLVEFDPQKVTYGQLLRVFWDNHDPTQVNRQGPDVGDSYRSAIWAFGEDQLALAQQSMASEQRSLNQPIATQISAIGKFWIAEDYHQQYHEKTGTAACPTGRG